MSIVMTWVSIHDEALCGLAVRTKCCRVGAGLAINCRRVVGPNQLPVAESSRVAAVGNKSIFYRAGRRSVPGGLGPVCHRL